MHRVNNHLHNTDCLASDYLNVLITYLRSIPHCPTHLQTIFHQYDETNKNKLDIQEFERLLSVLIFEACANSGYDAPQNTELTVSYILNLLIQINHSSTNMEFSQHFVTHLLTHLLSLKNKEQKITSTPKTKANIESNQSNIKLKKYKKVSPKLVNNIEDKCILITNNNNNRFSINRRKTKANRAKRSQSDGAKDEYKAMRQNKSRSKSTDLNQNEFDHVVLASSPTNNVLFKYQKHPTQNTASIKRKYGHNQYGSRLFPPLSGEHRNGYHKLKTANMNNISIERIPYHGNGSPSDSTSKSSKSTHSGKSIHLHDDVENVKMIKPTPRGVKISRRRTENNLLLISRDTDDDMALNINSDHIMLDLLTEISILQKEQKKSKHCYTRRISDLENKLKTVQSENTLMQQTLRLYEERIGEMERYIPIHYISQPIHYSQSSSTSSHSNCHNKGISISVDGVRRGISSKKCRELEKKLHLKILQQRKDELQSNLNNKCRKNRNLLRKKRFEPITLQNNIVLDDCSDNEALQIDPNAITLPLIIDESISNLSVEDNDNDDILDALQRENVTSHSTSESSASTEDAISSDCFHLFDDDGAESIDNDKAKYTDCMNIPHITIPKSDEELLAKVKPAYKHHLEMIDDDGSIAYQIEQRKKIREREKQQRHIKQLYSRQSNRRHHHNKVVPSYANINHSQSIKMCYFESKPLGFQINESPESIFVTNVYRDRGTAFDKGIERGWRIIEVNKQCGVKGMMSKLRNNNGPFTITFDTFTGSHMKHYNKMI